MRLDELDVLCAVLDCTPDDLMTLEPHKVAARRPAGAEAASGDPAPNAGSGGMPVVAPRLNRTRPTPPL